MQEGKSMNQQQQAVVQQTLEMANATLHEALEHIAKLKEENAALRQLLEQPVQEPVAWYRDEDGIRIYYDTKCWEDATPLYTTPPAQPTTKDSLTVDHGDLLTIAYLDGVHTGKQLAKREWVGLTEEDREQHRDDYRSNIHDDEFASIEAKLREKNGGAA
jgi:hypothetical protein